MPGVLRGGVAGELLAQISEEFYPGTTGHISLSGR